ncbi:MAG: hypothetical protein R6W70_09280 [bacterium]
MKNLFFSLFFIFLSLLSCDNDDYPYLPEDADRTLTDIDSTGIFEDETPDDDFKYENLKSRTVVAQVKSYDTPESGYIFISETDENENLKKFLPHKTFGDANGSDIAVSVQNDRLYVIERNGTDRVSCFYMDGSECGFGSFSTSVNMLRNFHDVLHIPETGETLISANEYNSLYLVSDDGKSREIDLSVHFEDYSERLSPSRLIRMEDTVYVSLQMLDSSFTSIDGYVLALDVHNLEKAEVIKLPVKNPLGRFIHNPEVDDSSIFIMCGGNWRENNGGLVKISHHEKKAELILSESDEESNILNGDFIDAALSDSGVFYIITASFSEGWSNTLAVFDVREGSIKELSEDVNAFAVNPIRWDKVKKRAVFFRDSKNKTFLVKYNPENESFSEELLQYSPSSLDIWYYE